VSFRKTACYLHSQEVCLPSFTSSSIPDCLSLEWSYVFRIERYCEIAAVLHACEFIVIAIDGRRQSTTHKLLIAIDVNCGL